MAIFSFLFHKFFFSLFCWCWSLSNYVFGFYKPIDIDFWCCNVQSAQCSVYIDVSYVIFELPKTEKKLLQKKSAILFCIGLDWIGLSPFLVELQTFSIVSKALNYLPHEKATQTHTHIKRQHFYLFGKNISMYKFLAGASLNVLVVVVVCLLSGSI